jgi:hypothetical protein
MIVAMSGGVDGAACVSSRASGSTQMNEVSKAKPFMVTSIGFVAIELN